MTSVSAIGQSVPRLDGREKATGATRYAGDLHLPGMVHARLVLSPHAHARIVRIDGRAAATQPGVVGVFTGHDLPLVKPDPTDRGRCPLAIGRVVFVGHPVAAVVAETEAQAEDAAQLVTVEYEALPAAVDPLAAMRPDAPRVREPGAGRASDEALAAHGAVVAGQAVAGPAAPNVASTTEFTRGDVERGLAEAAVVIERTYRTSMLHQGYLEPRAAVASVDPLGALLVWTSTQTLFHTRSQVAEAVGLPEHRVRVTATPLGGGFGAKFVLLEPLAAALALATRRPVSIVLSRTEEFLTTTPAPQSVFELRVGAGRDGRLTALDARIIFDAGAYAGAPVGIAALLLGGYYTVPNLVPGTYTVEVEKAGFNAVKFENTPLTVAQALVLNAKFTHVAVSRCRNARGVRKRQRWSVLDEQLHNAANADLFFLIEAFEPSGELVGALHDGVAERPPALSATLHVDDLSPEEQEPSRDVEHLSNREARGHECQLVRRAARVREGLANLVE